MDELVIYLIVRNDLKMSKGKIAAQCGHAIQWLTINGMNKDLFKLYLTGDHPKIVLKINSEEEMDKLYYKCKKMHFNCYQVIDAGRTQVPPNSKTVLGIGPVERGKAPGIIKILKLL